MVLQVSSDGRKVIAYQTNSPGFIYEFRSIELFNTWDGDSKANKNYDLMSLIDVTKIGQDTLLRTYKGWQSAKYGTPVDLTYSFFRPIELDLPGRKSMLAETLAPDVSKVSTPPSSKIIMAPEASVIL